MPTTTIKLTEEINTNILIYMAKNKITNKKTGTIKYIQHLQKNQK